MEWVIHVECRVAGQVLHRKEVASITRQDTPLHPEHVGLTLGDGTTVLSSLQRAVVSDQVDAEATAWWTCPHCMSANASRIAAAGACERRAGK